MNDMELTSVVGGLMIEAVTESLMIEAVRWVKGCD